MLNGAWVREKKKRMKKGGVVERKGRVNERQTLVQGTRVKNV